MSAPNAPQRGHIADTAAPSAADMRAGYVVGHVLDVLATMAGASVDLVLSSPPFLAQRSYLPAGHPAKVNEIGSEETPGAFIDRLIDVVEALARVLAPHGSLIFELGDTYAGSGGAGGDYNVGGLREGQAAFDGTARRARNNGHAARIPRERWHGSRPGWPLEKSLCLVPELLRIALAYGVNPLTGRETEPWRVRNVVRWCRPNPPVGALADKFRPATTDLLVACKGRSRYFDLDAVRVPFTGNPGYGVRDVDRPPDAPRPGLTRRKNTHDGAPPLDWWEVPTEPYKGSHYATWPSDLLVRPIEAMCPRRVCTACGKPSERIAETTNATGIGHVRTREPGKERAQLSTLAPDVTERRTLGWSDCGHNAWRPGLVLDPFAGTGTTLSVAFGHGRSSLGIDLDERNYELARQRVGMWLVEGI